MQDFSFSMRVWSESQRACFSPTKSFDIITAQLIDSMLLLLAQHIVAKHGKYRASTYCLDSLIVVRAFLVELRQRRNCDCAGDP